MDDTERKISTMVIAGALLKLLFERAPTAGKAEILMDLGELKAMIETAREEGSPLIMRVDAETNQIALTYSQSFVDAMNDSQISFKSYNLN